MADDSRGSDKRSSSKPTIWDRFVLAFCVLSMVAALEGFIIWIFIHIDWKGMDGGNAAVMATILSAIGTGMLALAKDVTSYYFGSSHSSAPTSTNSARASDGLGASITATSTVSATPATDGAKA